MERQTDYGQVGAAANYDAPLQLLDGLIMGFRVLAIALLVFVAVGFADGESRKSSPSVSLDAAKDTWRQEMSRIRRDVLKSLDEAKLAGEQQQKLSEAERTIEFGRIANERQEFLDSEKLPTSPFHKSVIEAFKKDKKKASTQLMRAFDEAAKDLDAAGMKEEAKKVRMEKKTFFVVKEVQAGPKYFAIQSVASSKIIGVEFGSSNAGAKAIQWTPVRLAVNQNWELVPVEGEWVRIRNRKSGLVLAIAAGSTNEGEFVIQWPAVESAKDHHWKLVPVEKNGVKAVQIVNRNSGKMLSLESLSKSDGVRLVQFSQRDGEAQQLWVLVEVE